MGLFWLSAAWLSGIALASHLLLPLSAWLLSAAALALAAYLLRTNRAVRWALALCCACALGAARAASPQGPDPGHISSFNDRPAEVRVLGTVIDAPDRRETYTALRVAVEAASVPASGLSGPPTARSWCMPPGWSPGPTATVSRRSGGWRRRPPSKPSTIGTTWHAGAFTARCVGRR